MRLLIDTHVHLRACFEDARVFDTAHAAFREAAAGFGDASFLGVLMLTESHVEDAFRRLEEQSGPAGRPRELPGWGGWRAERTGDGRSLLLARAAGRLLLVAGRQVDTAEGLEVSVLGSPLALADGTPIEEVLRLCVERGGVAVVPWAPGKWFFGRGRLLRRLMGATNPGFHLGENGGRTWLWPTPRHLRLARRLGLAVLPGSDPLPFPVELERMGRNGVTIDARLDEARPGEAVLDLLRAPDPGLVPYGKLADPVTFFWKELTMQWTKRRRKRMAAVRLDG